MKIVLIITSIIFSWVALGQSKVDVSEMTNFHMSEIESIINLTEEQTKETNTIILDFSEKMAVLINKDGGMFGKIGDIRKLGKEKNKKLGVVFSKEQMEKYEDEIEPKVRKQFRNRMKD